MESEAFFQSFPLLSVIAAAVGALAVPMLCLRRCPSGQCRVVERFSRFHRILMPGWHLILPFADSAARRIETHGIPVRLKLANIVSADEAVFGMGLTVSWYVADPRIMAESMQDPFTSVTDVSEDCLRRLMSERKLKDALYGRTLLERAFVTEAQARLAPSGIRIRRVDIGDAVLDFMLRESMKARHAAREDALNRAETQRLLTEAATRSTAMESGRLNALAKAETESLALLRKAFDGDVQAAGRHFLEIRRIAALERIAISGSMSRSMSGNPKTENGGT